MAKKVCIKLKDQANEQTRLSFAKVIELLVAIFDSGFSKQMDSGEERVYPIALVMEMDSSDSLAWFAISDNDYISHFEALTRLEMERHLVGDKYEIIIKP